jgi:anti-anti-sigma factor
LRVDVTRRGRRLTVSISGELDLASVDYLHDRMLPLTVAPDRPAEVVFDVAALTFVDVTGLRALVRVASTFDAAGAPVRLQRTSPQLERLLGLLGLDERLTSRPGDHG